ncbi:amidase domain-containing protein [Rathayibacter sp. YIM 133350]|uniref:amidase domain-containing protein n=1 Tax=Rathayibacter sp. YIM 133350 TaxID=3131992 RepID=UPI00307F7B4F
MTRSTRTTPSSPVLSSPSLTARAALLASRRHRRGRHARPSSFTGGTVLAGCGLALAITAGALTLGMGSDGSAQASVAQQPRQKQAASQPSARIDAAALGSRVRLPFVVNDGNPVIDALPVATQGPVTGGTTITLSGANLEKVASASVGGQAAALASVTPDAVTLTVPSAVHYAEGTAGIDLLDAGGAPVPVDLTPATTVAADSPVAVSAAPALTFTYVPDAGIQAQSAYIQAYWSNYNPDYLQLSGADCANFASQGLLARGWSMDADWWYAGGATSSSWVSSTALYGYLSAHPERATLLGETRDDLKVGDIAQFDWDGSGDWDHTATVTRVEHTDSGTRVWVGGHTKDMDFWNVDEALATGGSDARIAFWSIR